MTQVMAALLSQLRYRLLPLLLAVITAAYPLVAIAAAHNCASHAPSDPSCTAVNECCHRGDRDPVGAEPKSATDDPNPPCGLTCLAVCCRAIDLPVVRPLISTEHALHSDLAVPGASVVAAPVCEAVFHPPRA